LQRPKVLRRTYWGLVFAWSLLGTGYFFFLPQYSEDRFGVYALIICGMLAMLFASIFLIEKQKITFQLSKPLSMFVLGVIGYTSILFSFYLLFKRFQMSYVYEFLIPLTILAGVFLVQAFRHKLLRLITLTLITLSYSLSFFVVAGPWGDGDIIQNKHFRRHSVQTIQEVTKIIKAEVPENEELFSGNTLFAANSGLRLANDIAHPQYDYRDHSSSEKQEDLYTYLVEHNIMYAVYDYKMDYFYFEKNPVIRTYITNSFEVIYRDEENDISLLKKKEEVNPIEL